MMEMTDGECDRLVMIQLAGPSDSTIEWRRRLVRAAFAEGARRQRARDAALLTRLADGRGVRGHEKRHADGQRKQTTSSKKDRAAELALRQAAAAIERGGDNVE